MFTLDCPTKVQFSDAEAGLEASSVNCDLSIGAFGFYLELGLTKNVACIILQGKKKSQDSLHVLLSSR